MAETLDDKMDDAARELARGIWREQLEFESALNPRPRQPKTVELDADGHDAEVREDAGSERLNVEVIWLQYRDETVRLRVEGDLPVAWRWLRNRRSIATGVLRVDVISGKADLVLRLIPGATRTAHERGNKDVGLRPPARGPGGEPSA
ncbi:MAG: hypothetical protein V3U03_15845 [Myxococcota bacterium]